MLASKISIWFRETGILLLTASVAIGLNPLRAIASEKIIFNYGATSQSISFSELETFVNTGEISPSLDFLLKFGKQNPSTIRWILTQEFPANTQLIYDLLNTAPGEFVLSQTSTVVSSKSERANVQALRGALVTSASDDQFISLIELLENYPTQEVYVNGKILAKAHRNLTQFIEETNKYIQIPLSLLID